MGRTLFIGDSHTCGYWSHPINQGPGSYTYWNDNNYAEEYSRITGRPVAIYSMAGVNNRVYTDWMKSMFNRYDDIDEVFLCTAPFNRFTIGFDGTLNDEVISVDHFTAKMDSSDGIIDRYCDLTIQGENLQLFNKALSDDYNKFPGIDIDVAQGLKTPDLRKHTYMQVKLFFELNSFIEKRDFLLNVYVWDKLCQDHKAKLYLFNFTDRLRYPKDWNYYGDLSNTTVATKTVEGFFKERHIDHSKYYLEDNEHYNKEYHDLVADRYLSWLKQL